MRALPLCLCFCIGLGGCVRDEAPAPVFACVSQERTVTIDGVPQRGLYTICRDEEGRMALDE